MGPFGIPELLFILVPLVVLVLVPLIVAIVAFVEFRRRSSQLGYASVRAYLRAVPRTDAERRDAVTLALQGLVLCVLGLITAPVALIGLPALFYGTRKVAYAMLGLGLVDDAN